jgi:hypothetical protein
LATLLIDASGINLMDRASRIRFTKHADGKFETLKQYGFEIEKEDVLETVLHPQRLDERSGSF